MFSHLLWEAKMLQTPVGDHNIFLINLATAKEKRYNIARLLVTQL